MYVACMLCSVIVFFLNRVFVKLKKYDLFIITLGCPIEQHAIVLLIPKSKFQFAVIIFFFSICAFLHRRQAITLLLWDGSIWK